MIKEYVVKKWGNLAYQGIIVCRTRNEQTYIMT
jgi:hypothetical protein